MPDVPVPAPLAIGTMDSMPIGTFMASLGDLFEHSPWVMERVAAGRPFGTARALHDAAMAVVQGAGSDQVLSLLRAHPELAGQEAADAQLTADSGSEQGRLGFTRLSPAEHEELTGLNAAYRERFGFPCIVALARHTERRAVVAAIQTRVAGTRDGEIEANLVEIGHVTAARLTARLGRNGGGLSLHALDTRLGGGAAGLDYALSRAGAGGWDVLARGRTNGHGRTDGVLLMPLDMEAGRYRIEYRVGDYHRAGGVEQAAIPFLEVVPIEFGIADPAVHYHVPLQFTPWSYATYRGS